MRLMLTLESTYCLLRQGLERIFIAGSFVNRQLYGRAALLDEQIHVIDPMHATINERILTEPLKGNRLLGSLPSPFNSSRPETPRPP